MSDLQLRIAVDVIEKGLVQCERRNYVRVTDPFESP